ncbi:hypothetical protein CLF_104027, partial [Clonorchis sinensis]
QIPMWSPRFFSGKLQSVLDSRGLATNYLRYLNYLPSRWISSNTKPTAAVITSHDSLPEAARKADAPKVTVKLQCGGLSECA